MTVVYVALYCIGIAALFRAVTGPGEAPYGVNWDFWVRSVRAWRHRRNRR